MTYIIEPNTPSTAVNAALEKLNRNRTPPKVNLPALARRDERLMSCIKPAIDGHVFISSDFSSLEPSITAHFSGDKYVRYACYDGIGKEPYYDEHGRLMIDDVYLLTGSFLPKIKDEIYKVFSKPEYRRLWVMSPEQAKPFIEKHMKKPNYSFTGKDLLKEVILKNPRKASKMPHLMLNYGGGAKALKKQSFDAGLIMTTEESRGIHKGYWEGYHKVKELSIKLEKLLKIKGSIVNPFGYRLSTEPHKGYNAYIQSSASGVVDLLTIDFFQRCKYAVFVTLVHDEIIYSIPSYKIDDAKKLQDESVAWLNKTLNWSVPMRLGFQVAPSFKEIK